MAANKKETIAQPDLDFPVPINFRIRHSLKGRLDRASYLLQRPKQTIFQDALEAHLGILEADFNLGRRFTTKG